MQLLTPCSLVPVNLADLLATEKAGGASIDDVSRVGPAVAVAITHSDDKGGYPCPNAVYQSFLVVCAEESLGVFLGKHFKG